MKVQEYVARFGSIQKGIKALASDMKNKSIL